MAPFKKRILVADNQATLANALCELLRGSGYDAEAAHSGEGTVNAALRSRFDVIVLDLSMPQMDGFVAMEAIKALPNARQAIYCSHRSRRPQHHRSRFGRRLPPPPDQAYDHRTLRGNPVRIELAARPGLSARI